MALGAISLQVHLGFEKGVAFCFTLAPDEDVVRQAHENIGLPFDSITEVVTAAPTQLDQEKYG